MVDNLKPIDDLTFSAIQAENYRSQALHGVNAMINPGVGDAQSILILLEEVGEVGKALAEKQPNEELVKELIQVATMAAAWAQKRDQNGPESESTNKNVPGFIQKEFLRDLHRDMYGPDHVEEADGHSQE